MILTLEILNSLSSWLYDCTVDLKFFFNLNQLLNLFILIWFLLSPPRRQMYDWCLMVNWNNVDYPINIKRTKYLKIIIIKISKLKHSSTFLICKHIEYSNHSVKSLLSGANRKIDPQYFLIFIFCSPEKDDSENHSFFFHVAFVWEVASKIELLLWPKKLIIDIFCRQYDNNFWFFLFWK